jgi:hypothetical protein
MKDPRKTDKKAATSNNQREALMVSIKLNSYIKKA